jgi:hypothetical protein
MTEIIRVQGSHEQVGHQVGTLCRTAIRRAATITKDQLPAGRSRAEQLVVAAEYRAATEEALPWLLRELDATADAAGVDRDVLFAVSVEEIWPGRDTTAIPTPAVRGCTDVVATGPATADGRTLVGHNNDLPASTRGSVTPIEWRVDGEPVVFSLGIGPWLSAAWNQTGLNITGNELAPNDQRVGIPRLLLMSAVARARTIGEAVALAGHPSRASSYNWLLADAEGRVVSLEGSATAMAELHVGENGLLHHENHYVDPSMVRFERSPRNAVRSAARGARMSDLLGALPRGSVTSETIHSILADHLHTMEPICRHAHSANDMETVFWAVADLSLGQVDFGIGPPCTSAVQHYHFCEE